VSAATSPPWWEAAQAWRRRGSAAQLYVIQADESVVAGAAGALGQFDDGVEQIVLAGHVLVLLLVALG
jgi:hypothetical protein